MVCALALLAMAGGQAVHAGAELLCHHEQGAEEHTTCPEQDECPDGHCCCNVSSCMSSTLPELADRVFVSVCDPTGSFRIRNETCGDGPCREIDHPPQLA